MTPSSIAVGIFDIVRTFSLLSFNADASLFTTHVSGVGAQLAFSGLGIRSLDTVGAPKGRHTFFADAGSTGGTILFTNSAGINVGSYQFARPVDITAQGGSAAGAIGGHIEFQDNATTSGTTYDALRAAGATVAGASGGEVIIRDNALLTRLTGVAVARRAVRWAVRRTSWTRPNSPEARRFKRVNPVVWAGVSTSAATPSPSPRRASMPRAAHPRWPAPRARRAFLVMRA